MELYAVIARDRPDQVLGIFIRDANNVEAVPPLEDPTGEHAPRVPPVPQRRGTQSSSSSISSPPSNTTTLPDGRLLTTNRRRPLRTSSDTATPRATYSVRRSKRTMSDFQQQNPPGSPDYFGSTSLIDLPVTEEPEPIALPSNVIPYPPPSSYTPSAFTRRQDDETASVSSRMSLGRTSTSSSLRPPMTEAERKRYELQQRVYRARMEIPDRIPFRVFRDPSECVEARQILDTLNLAHSQM
jgi:hypothetical protein